MADPREVLGRRVHGIRLACEADRAAAEGRQKFHLGTWEERDDWQHELDMRIGNDVAAALREQAEATEARLAEIRQAISTFQAHYGHSILPTFKVANDLAEGIRQILDRQDAQ